MKTEKEGPKRGVHSVTLGKKMKETALDRLLKRGPPQMDGDHIATNC